MEGRFVGILGDLLLTCPYGCMLMDENSIACDLELHSVPTDAVKVCLIEFSLSGQPVSHSRAYIVSR